MNVLVIPEDFRKDQFILRPVIGAMLAHLGKPRAKVKVLTEPVLGGVDKALDWEHLAPVIERYVGMIQLFVLIVDRDGETSRRARLSAIEKKAHALLAKQKKKCFLAEHAIEEIEVWALAAQQLKWKWSDVQTDRNPKERYFHALAAQRDLLDEPGEGRSTLGEEAGKAYGRLRQLCKNDIQRLEQRAGAFIQNGTCG